jgi:hypothetical protein
VTVGPRYPLSALRAQRKRDAKSRTLDLATAIALANEAQQTALAAERRAAAAEAAAVAAAEATRRVPLGGLPAGALALAQAHARARRRVASAAREASRRADEEAELAREEMERARGALGAARADGELVERHHERWQGDRRRDRDRREE